MRGLGVTEAGFGFESNVNIKVALLDSGVGFCSHRERSRTLSAAEQRGIEFLT